MYTQLARLRSDRTAGMLCSHGKQAKWQHLDYVKKKTVEDDVLQLVVFRQTSQSPA